MCGYEINKINKPKLHVASCGHITWGSHPLQSGSGPGCRKLAISKVCLWLNIHARSLRPDSQQSTQAGAKQPAEMCMPRTPSGPADGPCSAFRISEFQKGSQPGQGQHRPSPGQLFLTRAALMEADQPRSLGLHETRSCAHCEASACVGKGRAKAGPGEEMRREKPATTSSPWGQAWQSHLEVPVGWSGDRGEQSEPASPQNQRSEHGEGTDLGRGCLRWWCSCS